jgi:hypothetical protein
MKRIKPYIIITLLTGITFFGIASLSSQCRISPPENTVVSSASGDTAASSASAATSAIETTAETTSAIETAAETASESSAQAELVDISKLSAVFAIANESGDKLISFYSDSGTTLFEELNGAIGEGGKFCTIEYIKKQAKNDQDSNRVVSSNFDNMEGYIYKTIGKKLIANNTYYLCNSEFLREDKLLDTISTGITVLDAAAKTQIQEIKGRSVQDGWVIDEFSNGIQVLVVVFKPEGSNFLMSIVLKTADGLKFMDYPVVSDGQSAWRVDDGGKIDPKLFSILFALPTNEGLLTVINWAGAEGENTIALIETADALSPLPWEVYRYWSAG